MKTEYKIEKGQQNTLWVLRRHEMGDAWIFCSVLPRNIKSLAKAVEWYESRDEEVF